MGNTCKYCDIQIPTKGNNEGTQHEPTHNDSQKAIKQLKPGKASGPDMILNELITRKVFKKKHTCGLLFAQLGYTF